MPPPTSLLLWEQVKEEIQSLVKINLQLSNSVKYLKCDYENSALDCEEDYKIISRLEKDLEIPRILKIKVLKNSWLRKKHIEDLELSNETL